MGFYKKMEERFAHIQSTKDAFLDCNAGIIDMLKYYHGEHLQMCLTKDSIIVSRLLPTLVTSITSPLVHLTSDTRRGSDQDRQADILRLP